MNVNRLLLAPCVFVVASLTACGGGDATDGADAAPAIDTTIITDIPREPLTEEDLNGMELANLSVELPWTRNIVSRDPGPAAARSTLELTESWGLDAFDRVSFTFSDATPFPGYEIRVVDAGATLTCGEEEHALDSESDRLLVVRLHPARENADGWRGDRAMQVDGQRFAHIGIVCDDGRNVTWVAGLSAGEEVRVLEFRSPQRLVVDFR